MLVWLCLSNQSLTHTELARSSGLAASAGGSSPFRCPCLEVHECMEMSGRCLAAAAITTIIITASSRPSIAIINIIT